MATLDAGSVYANVQSHYGSAAKATTKDENYGHAVASAFGYSQEELLATPSESNLGLSCGNPFAIANIREGETVIDLGSGAGFDVFQASKKVGKEGKVIGVDMNDDMLAKANEIKAKIGAKNTAFVKSKITQIDIASQTADCIISNCVINLVPEDQKASVFKEMHRMLKLGGRVSISDILLKKDLPDELRKDVALYVGCISGASKVDQYQKYLAGAGFKDIMIVPDKSDLNVYKTADEKGNQKGCCGPSKGSCSSSANSNRTKTENATDAANLDLNEWAASFKIYAVKQT